MLTRGHKMGKKNKKSPVQKKQLCSTFADKTIHRVIDDLWEKTSNWCGVSSVIPPLQTLWEEYDKLVDLVDILKKRQGDSPAPLPPREEGIAELKDWLKTNGAVFDKLDVIQYPNGEFGLKVIDGIDEDEKVLHIPEQIMLTGNEAFKSPLEKFVKTDPLLSAMPNLALAVVLLNERYNPDSFWRPYINTLPSEFDLPLFYTKEQLQELIGSPVLIESIGQLRNISRLYAIIYQRLRAHNDPDLFVSSVGFNYSDFVWAVSCIMSRQNKIPSKETSEPVLVLIPFWDMANHSPGKIMTDFETSSRSCVCYSMKKYSPGEEFTIFYGQRPNCDLLINQGFTYSDNPFDTVKVPVGLSRMEDNASRQIRQTLLERLKIQVPGQFLVRGGHIPFSPELMAFTRVFTAPSELLHEWKDFNIPELCNILMSENLYQRDIKSLEFLENRCALLLHPYKTTLEDDEKLLQQRDISSRVRSIIILRHSEKRILTNATRMAHKEKEMLEEMKQAKIKSENEATKSEEQTSSEHDDIEKKLVEEISKLR